MENLGNIPVTPIKKYLPEDVCVLCVKQIIESKRRVKLSKNGLSTETASIISDVINEDVSCGSIVCRICLDRVRNLHLKQSSFKKGFEQFKVTTERVKRCNDSPVQSSKRTPLKSLTNLQRSKVNRPLFTSPAEICLVLPAKINVTENISEIKSKPKVNSSTQTNDEEVTNVEVVIHYEAGSRTYKVPPERQNVVRQAVLGSSESLAKTMFESKTLRPGLIDVHSNVMKQELTDISARSSASLLRNPRVDSLKEFKWDTLATELKVITPVLFQTITNCVSQKSKKKSVMPALLFGMSILINTFCSELNLVKKIISVVLKRGGAKKRLFNSLSNLNICMSYRTTNSLFQSFGQDFDLKLNKWKKQVELDTEFEANLLRNITQMENRNELQDELVQHRQSMHPGFQFVGDNVDFVVKVRHMTSKNQNKDHHLFNCMAYKNRISGNSLSNERQIIDLQDYNLSQLLPSTEDNKTLIENLTHHVLKLWTSSIPTLNFFEKDVQPYISHRYMSLTGRKTEKVRLGVLAKNETKIDDMVEICQFLNQYVPIGPNGTPVKCLSGGDYLTFERHKKAQSTLQDSRTASERLEGLQAKFEEFHTQAEVNKVVWTLLYNTASAADIGTLYAARNAVDARNVTKDPGDNFYAASSLLDKYTEALVVAGGLSLLSLDAFDAELPEENRRFDFIREKAEEFVQKYCIPKVPDGDIETKQFDCALCGRSYVRKGNLVRHMKSVHKQEPESEKSSLSDDFKVNYTKCALPILMLRWNHNDAIRYCDGDRLELCHKFLIPYYKATGCVKYAFGTLEYLAQLKFLMSPRQALRLKWNRTANGRGCIDSNFPLDLDVEHENKVFKEHITTFRGEVTEKIIDTVSRSSDTSEKISKNLDSISKVSQQSGKHSTKVSHCDKMILIRQYIQADLFREQSGRRHLAFPDISANPFSSIDVEDFKKWIKKSVQKFHQKHFYN